MKYSCMGSITHVLYALVKLREQFCGFLNYYCFMCMGECLHTCLIPLWKPEEDTGYPGNGVTVKLSFGF